MDPFVVLPAGALDGRTTGDVVALPPATAKHLRTVLRRPPGSGLVLTDGVGTTVPAQLVEDGARCLADPTTTPVPVPSLHVLQGLAKGRKVDEVVRILTELGVDGITPVAAERSIKELEGAKRDKALARWRAVAVAASEQSRRPRVPVIDEPGTVEEVLDRFPDVGGASRVVVAHVGAGTPLSAVATPALAAVERVVLAVGPEGGWTSDEVARFADRGADVVTMGASVLRTEHAATVLAAVVSFRLGRMG